MNLEALSSHICIDAVSQELVDKASNIGFTALESALNIVNITKEISQKVASKNIAIDEIDEDLIAQISCCPVNDIDLLIRTGGDRRISNFLPYQIAYTEINFVDKYWPDFKREDFIECLDNFKKVSRMFGKRI